MLYVYGIKYEGCKLDWVKNQQRDGVMQRDTMKISCLQQHATKCFTPLIPQNFFYILKTDISYDICHKYLGPLSLLNS